ncbi:unnamed protein product [Rotaria sp. Silwood2]|nr:unnamed protein product [Rotaria sp. Silwood2]CAF2849713.1 unnamed protein product [Rotaria sp. Silwood2]CAF2973380.1 unnamed protein product [Rotaria sp. Silwood2]CAF3136414.1 unnamed protein product [Rotaria sp. Silwood2]CAF4141631.1 unnamed protein product [Rotaria sp. Silwood2]
MYNKQISTAENLLKNIDTLVDVETKRKKLFNDCYDILSSFLNFNYLHTKDPLDEKILLDYTKEFDKKLKADMNLLNVLPPLTLVYTSAFVHQIIDFICQLIHNDYAYVSNTSVYFDTLNFKRKFLHDKLKLDRMKNIANLCEREEALIKKNLQVKQRKINLIFFFEEKANQVNFLGHQHGVVVDPNVLVNVVLLLI